MAEIEVEARNMVEDDDTLPLDDVSKARKAAVDRLVGSRLRLCREMLGWTAEDMADVLGHDLARLDDYEAGRIRVPPADLAGIARNLQIPVIWFFVGLISPEGDLARLAKERHSRAASEEENVARQQLSLLNEELNRIDDPSIRIMLVDMARGLASHFR
jgi:transcriptional regulator with XRE-family HTH domain